MRFRNTTVSNGSAATSEDVLYTNLLFVDRPLYFSNAGKYSER